MKNKIIILGKNSYVGNALKKDFEFTGDECISVGRDECDLLSPTDIGRFFRDFKNNKITVVLCSVINKQVANSDQSFDDNCTMIRNLIQEFKKLKLRSLIYLGSVDVYGNKPELPITESTLIKPDSWYAKAKFECESILVSELRDLFPVDILRLPGVYGASSYDKSILNFFIQKLRAERSISLVGTGSIRRDYLYIKDLINIIRFLILTPVNATFNVATGNSSTLLEIIKIIIHEINANGQIKFVDRHNEDDRQFDLEFDISELRKIIPNYKFCSIQEGIRSYLL